MRPARSSDLPLILRWERGYIRSIEPAAEAGWTEAIDRNLEQWVSCLDRTAILEFDGEPCGSMMWMPTGDTATLIGIHVVPELRRRGFGRLLLDAFAGQAGAAGHHTLALGVHRDNPARRLYEDHGYRRTGEDGDYVLLARPVHDVPVPGEGVGPVRPSAPGGDLLLPEDRVLCGEPDESPGAAQGDGEAKERLVVAGPALVSKVESAATGQPGR